MIDYLELLLDAQVQDEQEETPVWGAGVSLAVRRGTQAGSEEAVPVRTAASRTAEGTVMPAAVWPPYEGEEGLLESGAGIGGAGGGGTAADVPVGAVRTGAAVVPVGAVGTSSAAGVPVGAVGTGAAAGVPVGAVRTETVVGVPVGAVGAETVVGVPVGAVGTGAAVGVPVDAVRTGAAVVPVSAVKTGAAAGVSADTAAAEMPGSEPAGTEPVRQNWAESAGFRIGAAEDAIAGARAAREQDFSLSGASMLYRQMTQAGLAAGHMRQSTKLLTVLENAAPTSVLGAAELDEIFSRDARRYNGGFSLF